MVKPLEIFKLAAMPSWVPVETMEGLLKEVATSVRFDVAVIGLLGKETIALFEWMALLVVILAVNPADEMDGLMHLVSVHVIVCKLVVKIVDVITFPETSEYKL